MLRFKTNWNVDRDTAMANVTAGYCVGTVCKIIIDTILIKKLWKSNLSTRWKIHALCTCIAEIVLIAVQSVDYYKEAWDELKKKLPKKKAKKKKT